MWFGVGKELQGELWCVAHHLRDLSVDQTLCCLEQLLLLENFIKFFHFKRVFLPGVGDY